MKNIRETIKTIVKEESEYQKFFKNALEKSGKSIPNMSDEEKKAFFNKIDAAWDGKGEKNEELTGNQHKLDIDGDGEIEASDLAALRAGKKKNESHTESKVNEAEFKAGDKIKHKKANTGTFVVLNTDNGIKVKNLNTGRVFNNLLNPTEYTPVNEGVLGTKWRDNNKKGYNLKVGNIRLQSAGPDKNHSIYKNNSLWGKFRLDYEALFNDWHVQPINRKDFWVDSIDDIVKAVKEETRFMESANENFNSSDIETIKKGVSEGILQDIEKKLKSLSNGAKVSGGGYGPYVKTHSDTFKHPKTGNMYHSAALSSLIGSFKDFKIVESVNENFSPSDIEKIKKAVEDSATFMQIGRGLQKIGMKYGFMTSPHPIYMIKKGSKTYVLINKKYADDPEFVIGDTAGGLLEGITKSIKESVNESIITEDIDTMYLVLLAIAQLGALGQLGFRDIGDYERRLGPIDSIKKWWKDKKDDKAVKSIIAKIKSDPEMIAFFKMSQNQQKGQFRKLIATKLSGEELQYLNRINKSDLQQNESIVNEAKFKKGDTVIVKYPTLIKPIKGVVSTVLSGPDGDIVVLGGKQGVWDIKYVTLNEGNAFGMAVTAAKKEGLKEFEFNGKKYKVKKGAYEKNEAAKKLAEKSEVVAENTHVVVSIAKDGYGTLMSKAVDMKMAEKLKKATTAPRGEELKVITVSDAKNMKGKLIGGNSLK